MGLLRLAIAVVALIIGALGVLTGSVVAWSALKEGEITTYSATNGAPPTRSTVSRAREPDRFWVRFGMLSALPIAAGALVAGVAWRRLRS